MAWIISFTTGFTAEHCTVAFKIYWHGTALIL